MVNSFINHFDNVEGELATLNLGPTHPATHGIFQNILKMDGEKIVHAEQTTRRFIRLEERRQSVNIQAGHMDEREKTRNRQQQDREEQPGLEFRDLETVGEGLNE